jgi:hypothetical protein
VEGNAMEKAMWLILGVMLGALTLLLRAERRTTHTGMSGADGDGPVAQRGSGLLTPGGRR